MKKGIDEKWQELFVETTNELGQWRDENKRAKFNDIEEQLDKRLARVRRQLLQDLAQESPSVDIRKEAREERPVCPECAEPLRANGQQKRKIVTSHEQELELERSYGQCPKCGQGFFPPR